VQKIAPSRGKLAGMVLFAFSCFAILLYIWKAFGGPSPLAPEGYRFSAEFNEATSLADAADVRISGVPVGRVVSTRLSGDRTRATIEIEERYAPIPRDTVAILRLKTLLGETFVELSPGDRAEGELPDGGELERSQIRSTVELDEVTRAFDKRTRADLQQFVRSLGVAMRGRGQDLNEALGQLRPFSDSTGDMLAILREQHGAVRRVTRDTGVVFGALARREGELSGLIRAGDRVLATTARRNADLAEAVRILPTTLAELRPTIAQLQTVAVHAAPVMRELRPAAQSLGPTLIDAAALAPDLEELFGDLDRVISVSRTALPAATDVVEAAHPVFGILVPTLQEALPVVQYLGLYRQELPTALANLAASTQAGERGQAGGPPIKYLRTVVPFTAEGGAVQDRRFGTNRHNPYFLPLGLLKLSTGLESFDCENTGNPGSGEPAPPCKVQQPLEFQGRRTAFPRVEAAP
jgi:virulence factor Mce-like protein